MLVIVGVAVLLVGVGWASLTLVAVGSVLLVVGVSVHGAMIVWTGSVAARWPRGPGSDGAGSDGPLTATHRQCPSCAWHGITRGTVCPRCGHYLVPSPGGGALTP